MCGTEIVPLEDDSPILELFVAAQGRGGPWLIISAPSRRARNDSLSSMLFQMNAAFGIFLLAVYYVFTGGIFQKNVCYVGNAHLCLLSESDSSLAHGISKSNLYIEKRGPPRIRKPI